MDPCHELVAFDRCPPWGCGMKIACIRQYFLLCSVSPASRGPSYCMSHILGNNPHLLQFLDCFFGNNQIAFPGRCGGKGNPRNQFTAKPGGVQNYHRLMTRGFSSKNVHKIVYPESLTTKKPNVNTWDACGPVCNTCSGEFHACPSSHLGEEITSHALDGEHDISILLY